MSKKAIIIIAVVVLIAVFAGISMMSDTVKTTNVDSAVVARQNLTEKVSASGRIQPQTKVDLTSEINGEIMALLVAEGQSVRMGDLLIVLDTVQIKADVDQARYSLDGALAQRDGAKANHDQAEEEYQRQQRLYDKNLTSETAFNAARYAYLNAKAAHESAQAQARAAEAAYDKQLDRFSKAKIVAPMAGVITYLDCEVGEIAAAQTSYTQGKTLMTISDLSVFEVEIEVDETEINKIDLGQTAEIEVDAIPDTSFVGKVVEIGNTAVLVGAGTQDQSTNFKVTVMFADVDVKLRPGMSATVDVTSNERTDILAVPFAAVVMRSYDMDSLETARQAEASGETASNEVQAAENDSDGTEPEVKEEEKKREDIKGVFVIRDGVARFVAIGTGIAGQKNIEVTEGLTEADTVISGPYSVLRTIKDGDAVEITKGKNGEES